MNTVTKTPPARLHATATPDAPYYSTIKDYYNIAGPDYEAWSKNFNMHFGYCKQPSDVFSLKKCWYG